MKLQKGKLWMRGTTVLHKGNRNRDEKVGLTIASFAKWRTGYLKKALFSSVKSLSRVWLFVTPWTTAHQASLSTTNSWSVPKLMSTESVMPSNHLFLCHPLLLLPSIIPSNRSSSQQLDPATGSFQMSQLFSSGGQSIRVSASTSVLPVNTQDCSPLEWTGWICLQSKGLQINSDTVSPVSLSICHEVMGPDAMILVFWISFKPTFSLSSFTLTKRLFSSSLLSSISLLIRSICDWHLEWGQSVGLSP